MKPYFGILQPLAYDPRSSGGSSGHLPVMDLLVTDCIQTGTVLSFRFYPSQESYLTPYATTVSFVLAVSLQPGWFLRLTTNSVNMQLKYRQPGVSTTFNIAAGLSNAVLFGATFTCLVFLQSDCFVTAIGLRDGASPPMFPPTLPLDFTIISPLPADASSFVYFSMSTTPIYIPENWRNSWLTIRPITRWISGLSANYDTLVRAIEDKLAIQLVPGQITPIAFKDYVPTVAAAAVWCVLVTSTVPARTIVNFSAKGWALILSGPDADCYVWNSGVSDIPCGTVVTFSNLGDSLFTPYVNVGSIAAVSITGIPIRSLTAYVPTSASSADAIAGTYTVNYVGVIPPALMPGVTNRKYLWPSGASIIAGPPVACGTNCTSATLAIAANTTCLEKWITQPTPISYPCCQPRCGTSAPTGKRCAAKCTRSACSRC